MNPHVNENISHVVKEKNWDCLERKSGEEEY